MKRKYVRPSCVRLPLEAEAFLCASPPGTDAGPAATDRYSTEEMMTNRKRMWRNGLWEEGGG